MTIMRRLRTTAIAAATTAAALAAVTLGAGPAHASSQGCADNVCILLSGNAGGTALVQGWARNTTFSGQLTLTGPGNLNSGRTGTWKGGKGNYAEYTLTNSWSGVYCITGVASNGAPQGTACKTLS